MKSLNISDENFFEEHVIDYFIPILYCERNLSINLNRNIWAVKAYTENLNNIVSNTFFKNIIEIRANTDTNKLNLNHLTIIHSTILNNKVESKFRTHEVSYAKISKSNRYLYPAVNDTELNELIYLFNSASSVSDVAKFYTKFIQVHPFTDGNGRVAKILVDVLLRSMDLKLVNPHIYFMKGLFNRSDSGLIITESNAIDSIHWAMEITCKIKEKFLTLANTSYYSSNFHGISNEIILSSSILMKKYNIEAWRVNEIIREHSNKKNSTVIQHLGETLLINNEILGNLTEIDKKVLIL